MSKVIELTEPKQTFDASWKKKTKSTSLVFGNDEKGLQDFPEKIK